LELELGQGSAPVSAQGLVLESELELVSVSAQGLVLESELELAQVLEQESALVLELGSELALEQQVSAQGLELELVRGSSFLSCTM
jgi:hypothetical protein